MTFALPFATATATSLAVGWAVRAVALRLGGVVRPTSDRWHRRATPTFGGVAICIGTLVGIATAGAWSWPLLVVLGAALSMWVAGIVDDSLRLSPLAKL